MIFLCIHIRFNNAERQVLGLMNLTWSTRELLKLATFAKQLKSVRALRVHVTRIGRRCRTWPRETYLGDIAEADGDEPKADLRRNLDFQTVVFGNGAETNHRVHRYNSHPNLVLRVYVVVSRRRRHIRCGETHEKRAGRSTSSLARHEYRQRQQ